MNSQQTALYRHYDAAGTLLYVGISLSAAARLAQHMQGSPWARDIVSMRIEHHSSRAAAAEAEKAAIQAERPLWNKVHNVPARVPAESKRPPRPGIPDSAYAENFHSAIRHATDLLIRLKEAAAGFVVSKAEFNSTRFEFVASFGAGAYDESELLGEFKDTIMSGKNGGHNIVMTGRHRDRRVDGRLVGFDMEADTESNLMEGILSLAPKSKEFADEYLAGLVQAKKEYGAALQELVRVDFRKSGLSPAFILPKRKRAPLYDF